MQLRTELDAQSCNAANRQFTNYSKPREHMMILSRNLLCRLCPAGKITKLIDLSWFNSTLLRLFLNYFVGGSLCIVLKNRLTWSKLMENEKKKPNYLRVRIIQVTTSYRRVFQFWYLNRSVFSRHLIRPNTRQKCPFPSEGGAIHWRGI